MTESVCHGKHIQFAAMPPIVYTQVNRSNIAARAFEVDPRSAAALRALAANGHKKTPPGPGVRLRGKHKAPSVEELERTLPIMETWLAAKHKRCASAAEVMRSPSRNSEAFARRTLPRLCPGGLHSFDERRPL